MICQICISFNEIAKFANSVDLDEAAHNEPPHLDLLWLLSSSMTTGSATKEKIKRFIKKVKS